MAKIKERIFTPHIKKSFINYIYWALQGFQPIIFLHKKMPVQLNNITQAMKTTKLKITA